MEETHAAVMQDRRITTRLLAECLESVRKEPGKLWKQTCRKGRFVRDLCRTPYQLKKESIGLNFVAVSLVC
jgi:hypothetical protein